MRDARYEMRDTGCGMRDAGCGEKFHTEQTKERKSDRTGNPSSSYSSFALCSILAVNSGFEGGAHGGDIRLNSGPDFERFRALMQEHAESVGDLRAL